MKYKGIHIDYPMLLITLAVLVLFVGVYTSALAEPPSHDSGPNLGITMGMALFLFFLSSSVILRVQVEEECLTAGLGYGLFRKVILLRDIKSARTLKDPWLRGWGPKVWSWPRMWRYTILGIGAVEIELKNGKTIRIGAKEPSVLHQIILRETGLSHLNSSDKNRKYFH